MRHWDIERDEHGRAARMVWTGPDTVAAESQACLRPSCKRSVPPQRVRHGKCKVYCTNACRTKHWDETHPRVTLEQRRLDWTPTASAVQHVAGKRETKAAAILTRLRQGPATSYELMQVGGLRYSARIFELREAGHTITTDERLSHALYTLEKEA